MLREDLERNMSNPLEQIRYLTSAIETLKHVIVALLQKLDASPDLAATDFESSLTNPPDITNI